MSNLENIDQATSLLVAQVGELSRKLETLEVRASVPAPPRRPGADRSGSVVVAELTPGMPQVSGSLAPAATTEQLMEAAAAPAATRSPTPITPSVPADVPVAPQPGAWPEADEVRTYVAPAGETLQRVLVNWCREIGCTVSWETNIPYRLRAGATMTGTFEEV